jgi:hypothetical protein
VNRRDRIASHLDPLDQSGIDHEKVEASTAAVGRVVEPYPVEQHEGEIGLPAADREESSTARPAGRKGAHSGHFVECLEQGSRLNPVDLLRLDDAQGAGRSRFGSRGGDHDRRVGGRGGRGRDGQQ